MMGAVPPILFLRFAFGCDCFHIGVEIPRREIWIGSISDRYWYFEFPMVNINIGVIDIFL